LKLPTKIEKNSLFAAFLAQKKVKNTFFSLIVAIFFLFFLLKSLFYLYLRKQNKIYFIHITNFIKKLYTMNKTELVQAIAEKANLTKVDSKAALDATLEAITAALKKGDKVSLIGFGTFQVVKKNARQGINPATKQKIKIAAKKVVKFKPGAGLANKVNAKK